MIQEYLFAFKKCFIINIPTYNYIAAEEENLLSPGPGESGKTPRIALQ